ncbi:MAG TPA: hypothetical protein VLB76_10075 [Thermoanaerobaculia bacterium]|jgi:hypothetical protein|nr:hypothetical protein [Thermoanaerobaculia bacterium]
MRQLLERSINEFVQGASARLLMLTGERYSLPWSLAIRFGVPSAR